MIRRPLGLRRFRAAGADALIVTRRQSEQKNAGAGAVRAFGAGQVAGGAGQFRSRSIFSLSAIAFCRSAGSKNIFSPFSL